MRCLGIPTHPPSHSYTHTLVPTHKTPSFARRPRIRVQPLHERGDTHSHTNTHTKTHMSQHLFRLPHPWVLGLHGGGGGGGRGRSPPPNTSVTRTHTYIYKRTRQAGRHKQKQAGTSKSKHAHAKANAGRHKQARKHKDKHGIQPTTIQPTKNEEAQDKTRNIKETKQQLTNQENARTNTDKQGHQTPTRKARAHKDKSGTTMKNYKN